MPATLDQTPHAILHTLTLTRFAEYRVWCEGQLEEGHFDFHQTQRSYNTLLRKRFAAIAFMASRLQNTADFVNVVRQWIMSEWVGVEVRREGSGGSAFGSLLAISTAHQPQQTIAESLFICHLIDILSFCRDCNDHLTGICLEHYFSHLHELAAREQSDQLALLSTLAKAIHGVAPETFCAALSQVVRQPLLKPVKHEYLVRSLDQLDFAVFPMERLLVNLRFLETLVVAFSTAHGYRLKESYICFFSLLFARLAGRVEVEGNLVEWRDVVERLLYKKLAEFLGKPRYNAASARLLACLVLVSSEDFFTQHWYGAADLIVTRIRDKYLEPIEFKLVVQLVHVHFNRYPVAWATMSQRIEALNRSIHTILPILIPPRAETVLVETFVQYLTICGLKLTRLTVNDMIIPLLDVSQQQPDCWLKGVLAAVTTYNLIVKRLQRRMDRPAYPDRHAAIHIPDRLHPLTDDFYAEHLQIDLYSMHMKYVVSLGGVLLYLDEQLWSDSHYDGGSVGCVESMVTADAELVMVEILGAVPEITPSMSDPRLLVMLMVKYLFYDNPSVQESASQAIERIIDNLLEGEEMARKWEMMFWALMANVDAASERCTRGLQLTCGLVGALLSSRGAAWKHLPEDDRAAIVQELTLKVALMSANSLIPVRELMVAASELASSLTSNTVFAGFQDMLKQPNLLTITTLPLIDGLRVVVVKRICELVGELSGQRERQFFMSEESKHILSVHTAYLQFFLHHGPPHTSDVGKRKSRRVSISAAFSTDSLASSAERHVIRSVSGLCQLCLPLLLHDSVHVRGAVVSAFSGCHPRFLEDVLQCLVPYEKIISNDLRNIKYRFSRRNKKSDQLKLDFTKLLGSLMLTVLPKRCELFQWNPPKATPSVQFMLKCLLEVFYFCSEIDVDCVLPSLREHLAMMIAGWGRAVLDGPCSSAACSGCSSYSSVSTSGSTTTGAISTSVSNTSATTSGAISNTAPNTTNDLRFHYIPFKLHSEMWLTLRRWMLAGGHERALSTSTHSSLAPNTPNTPPQDHTTTIQAMVTLCWGLSSPSPGHRQDSVSLSQFFHWTDQLIATGHHVEAGEAVRRLVGSNLAVSDRVLEKAFAVRHGHYDSVVQNLPTVTAEQKQLLTIYKQKIQCNLR